MKYIITGLVVVVIVGCVTSVQSYAGNEAQDPRVQKGKVLYDKYCTPCHGVGGRRDLLYPWHQDTHRPPDLPTTQWWHVSQLEVVGRDVQPPAGRRAHQRVGEDPQRPNRDRRPRHHRPRRGLVHRAVREVDPEEEQVESLLPVYCRVRVGERIDPERARASLGGAALTGGDDDAERWYSARARAVPRRGRGRHFPLDCRFRRALRRTGHSLHRPTLARRRAGNAPRRTDCRPRRGMPDTETRTPHRGTLQARGPACRSASTNCRAAKPSSITCRTACRRTRYREAAIKRWICFAASASRDDSGMGAGYPLVIGCTAAPGPPSAPGTCRSSGRSGRARRRPARS